MKYNQQSYKNTVLNQLIGQLSFVLMILFLLNSSLIISTKNIDKNNHKKKKINIILSIQPNSNKNNKEKDIQINKNKQLNLAVPILEKPKLAIRPIPDKLQPSNQEKLPNIQKKNSIRIQENSEENNKITSDYTLQKPPNNSPDTSLTPQSFSQENPVEEKTKIPIDSIDHKISQQDNFVSVEPDIDEHLKGNKDLKGAHIPFVPSSPLDNQEKAENIQNNNSNKNTKLNNSTVDYKILVTDPSYNLFQEKNNIKRKEALTILELILKDLKNYYKDKNRNLTIHISILMNKINYPFFHSIIILDKNFKERFKVRYSKLLNSILTDMNYLVIDKKTSNHSTNWIKTIKLYLKNQHTTTENPTINKVGRDLLAKFLKIFSNNIYYLVEEIMIDIITRELFPITENENNPSSKSKKALNYASVSAGYMAKKETLIGQIQEKFSWQVNQILKHRLTKVPVLIIKTKNSWDAITMGNALEENIQMNEIMINFNAYPIEELKNKIEKLFYGEILINIIEMDIKTIQNITMQGNPSKNFWDIYQKFLTTNNGRSLLCLVKNNVSQEFNSVILDEIVYGQASQLELLKKNNDNKGNNDEIEYEIYVFPKIIYTCPIYNKSLSNNHGCFTFLKHEELNKLMSSSEWKKLQMGFITVELEKLIKYMVHDCYFTPIEISGKKENLIILSKNPVFCFLEFQIESDNSNFTTILENFLKQLLHNN